MLDHLELKTHRLAECAHFYGAVLAPLGYANRTTGASPGFGDGSGLDLFLVSGEPSMAHFAFRAPNRQAVRQCCGIGALMGSLDRVPALATTIHPNYFAGYLRDPDGRSVEFVCHEAEDRDLAEDSGDQTLQLRMIAGEAAVTSTSNVTPRPWGRNCQTWELLARTDIAVFHERMPPGTAEQEHSHAKARQFFFVLEGALNIRLLGRDILVLRHHGLEVPPGARHWVRNESGQTTEFLAIAHPSTLGDRIDTTPTCML
jgi:mannose-6-phosphate isomerase-like protein (cupin superfamily)/catechol 2,3-dioxygenase-like lactoylglutathione lyase family enzyme